MASDDPESAPEQYGRYRLIEQIGRGGMAEVFRASVDGFEGFRDNFVIKRIRPEKSDSAEFVEMFCNEARICALLQHPNIVEVYDFGQIGGAYFMAMEYLRGRDLAAVMRALRLRLAAVPPLVAAHVAHQIALGLDHAHGARLPDGRPAEIVHRDVTPSNIMLLRTGGVKVLDFGIAKAAAAARPTGAAAPRRRVKGKIAYLSPEQVRNGELDGRSDVFSLGVVLWEMLAGQRLFAGDNEFQTLRNVLTLPVPPPSSRRPEVPRELDAIVARALERERDARYLSAAAFAEALGAVLAVAPQAAEHGEGVRSLLTLLFGDPGAPDEPERFTLSFTSSDSMSMSSPGLVATGEAPPEPPAAPPAPVAPAWWSRAGLPWLLAALVVVASVAWLLLR